MFYFIQKRNQCDKTSNSIQEIQIYFLLYTKQSRVDFIPIQNIGPNFYMFREASLCMGQGGGIRRGGANIFWTAF